METARLRPITSRNTPSGASCQPSDPDSGRPLNQAAPLHEEHDFAPCPAHSARHPTKAETTAPSGSGRGRTPAAAPVHLRESTPPPPHSMAVEPSTRSGKQPLETRFTKPVRTGPLSVKPVRPGSGLGRYQTGQNSKFKFEFKKIKNFQKYFKVRRI